MRRRRTGPAAVLVVLAVLAVLVVLVVVLPRVVALAATVERECGRARP